MKIALLGTRGVPAKYGGFETFAEELAIRLVDKGVDVTVYCEGYNHEKVNKYKDIKLVYISVPAYGPLTTVLFDVLCLWHARKAYDVVYMLGYGAAPFCLIPRFWGANVWLNVDGIEWARAKWSAIAKIYFKFMEYFSSWVPHRIIADAHGIREHFESRHKLSIPCTVIPYGAPVLTESPDASLINEWNLETGKYYLVVARLEPENHVKEIIEGYLGSNTDFPLIVVGNHKIDSNYVSNLLVFSSERVRFLGGVYEKPKLQSLRYHSFAYFHGHSVGGTNPSLLEALGCGNLTIAHDNVFNREVIGQKGFYFQQPDDIKVHMATIESLSVEQRTSLAKDAQNRIRESYHWDSIAQKYLNLIKEDCNK